MSYKNLEIWKLAREQSIEIHAITMSLGFELLGKKLNNFLQAIQDRPMTPARRSERITL